MIRKNIQRVDQDKIFNLFIQDSYYFKKLSILKAALVSFLYFKI
jgi:hypothetical protein